MFSAICKCMVEPVSSSSSEVLLPSRCLHRAATALETCSSDSLDSAAAFAGDFAFFEPLLGAGDLAFLELLGGTAAGGAFAFFALGTGAAAAGVAAVSATLRFFGFSAGVGVAVAGSLTPFRFVGLSAFAGAGLLGMVGRPRGKSARELVIPSVRVKSGEWGRLVGRSLPDRAVRKSFMRLTPLRMPLAWPGRLRPGAPTEHAPPVRP